VTLDRGIVEIGEAVGTPAPDFILANGAGGGYGLFVPDPASRAYLLANLPDIPEPLVRGVAWGNLWEAMLAGHVAPGSLADLALRALPAESDELNVQRILDDLAMLYWRFLSLDGRERLAPEIEALCLRSMDAAGSTTRKAAYRDAFRSMALTPDAVRTLRSIWARERPIDGLTLSERDETAMALELAVRGVPDAEAILDAQSARIDNPDRRARFEFIRPALSPQPEVREGFFARLRDPANRAHEPWVLDGVRYLHHPLRAASSEPFILPSLEMLEEIQRTGDIFFPKRWLDVTLGGHRSASAARTVRGFLADHPDLPPRLRGKLLQSADGLFRAASMTP
jgi:aminopeptidase N